MTFEEFYEELIDLGIWIDPDDHITVNWTIGGMSGGNCWGAPADMPISAEPEPEFEELDKILEIMAPNLTFMQYKKLYREIIKSGSKSIHEYYGNYTEYGYKTVKIRDLYEWLDKNLPRS